MLILKDEHAIDVLKSGNTGHLWHDFHAIGVHATDVGHPDDDDDDDDDDDNDECVDLGGWQVEPRIVRIASIRQGESNSSSALGLESEFCDKPGNSYFCRDAAI